jgi:hypothetical protein
MDPLSLLLHRFAVLDPDGLALRGDLLLRAWGWPGAVDRLSFVRLDETPFLPRLQRVVANRELDHLRFDSAAVDGDGFCVTGPDGPIRVEAIDEPCSPEPDWVEVPGGTPILGWRPESAAVWLERAGRDADLAWLARDRDLDPDFLAVARAARHG